MATGGELLVIREQGSGRRPVGETLRFTQNSLRCGLSFFRIVHVGTRLQEVVTSPGSPRRAVFESEEGAAGAGLQEAPPTSFFLTVEQGGKLRPGELGLQCSIAARPRPSNSGWTCPESRLQAVAG